MLDPTIYLSAINTLLSSTVTIGAPEAAGASETTRTPEAAGAIETIRTIETTRTTKTIEAVEEAQTSRLFVLSVPRSHFTRRKLGNIQFR
ncbi:hypothetical protein P4H65_08925 [Paenibacillus chitinolyticus]|nr:hypothetical protein [Paenibacillus chitinolyticus]MEC0245907.1 hypothetical protein [Paenibacillus chitinolyticus]